MISLRARGSRLSVSSCLSHEHRVFDSQLASSNLSLPHYRSNRYSSNARPTIFSTSLSTNSIRPTHLTHPNCHKLYNYQQSTLHTLPSKQSKQSIISRFTYKNDYKSLQNHSFRYFSNNNNNNNQNSNNNNNSNSSNSNENINENVNENMNENDNETRRLMEDLNSSEYVEMTIGEKQRAHRTATILTWKSVGIATVFLLFASIFGQQMMYRSKQQQRQDKNQVYGDALIGGGNWDMVDHNRNIVNQDTYKGKYQIVYFGFTFCPDVCPRELTKMAQAIQFLEDRGYGDDFIPVFVSVDPKRDTPELVSKFIRQFHPKIVGLTGTPDKVAKFAKAYKAYYSTPGPGENPDDYIVDHVTMMYVMGRYGEYLGHISTLENADEMANKVALMFKDVEPSSGFIGRLLHSPKFLGGTSGGK